MADGVRVTEGVGPVIDADELLVDGTQKQRQRVQVGGSTGGEIAEITSSELHVRDVTARTVLQQLDTLLQSMDATLGDGADASTVNSLVGLLKKLVETIEATQSDALTDVELRAADVAVTLDGEPVSVDNFPTDFPLPSGQVSALTPQTDALTDTELRAAPLEVDATVTTPARAVRLDDASTPSTTYVGKAPTGASPGDPVWQVQRLDEASGLVVAWADGDALFDNIWNDRVSLTYA